MTPNTGVIPLNGLTLNMIGERKTVRYLGAMGEPASDE